MPVVVRGRQALVRPPLSTVYGKNLRTWDGLGRWEGLVAAWSTGGVCCC